MGDFAVILPAAGRSTRFGGGRDQEKKVYTELNGRAVWLRSVELFVNRPDVGQILVVVSPEDREMFDRRYAANVAFLDLTVVEGGHERVDSVTRALEAVRPSCSFIAVHDAARPCARPQQIDAVFRAAREHGAAILAVPVRDTLKREAPGGTIAETVPRAGLHGAQTPQVFRADWLRAAYANRDRAGEGITDDAQLVEHLGHPVALVEGSPWNLKITARDDLDLASAILKLQEHAAPEAPRHPFANDRPAWLEEDDASPKRPFDELF